MTDDEMNRFLEDFANSHTLATDIEVKIECGHASFKPRFPSKSIKREDREMLSEFIKGATYFMYWAMREGKVRLVKRYQNVTSCFDKLVRLSSGYTRQSSECPPQKGAKNPHLGSRASKKSHTENQRRCYEKVSR